MITYLTFIPTLTKTNSKENYVNSCRQTQKIDDVRLENVYNTKISYKFTRIKHKEQNDFI